MPFTPNDPLSVPINHGEVDVNTVHVVELDIALPPTDLNTSEARVIVAYGNTVDTTFTEVKREAFMIPSVDLLAIMGGNCDGNKTFYENIKDQIYGWLSDNGKLPAGTVS